MGLLTIKTSTLIWAISTSNPTIMLMSPMEVSPIGTAKAMVSLSAYVEIDTVLTASLVKFPSSGVTVTWSNYGSSEYFSLNEFSGIGDNSYQYWNIYRDNEYQLYETNNGWQCHVQYFMF